MVTINSSIADFNADVGGIKTSLTNSIAAAAGVRPDQVKIDTVTPRPGGGRRGGIYESAVSVKVFGSHALGIIKHRNAISTVWHPQHSVHVRRALRDASAY